MQNLFQIGDKVFDIQYGWGIVEKITQDWQYINFVRFDNNIYDSYTYDGKSDRSFFPFLSFTEYTMQGFSQERPEELLKKGQICWGRNELPSEWNIGYFFEKRGDKYLMNSHPLPTGWHIEVIEITTENPYKDV